MPPSAAPRLGRRRSPTVARRHGAWRVRPGKTRTPCNPHSPPRAVAFRRDAPVRPPETLPGPETSGRLQLPRHHCRLQHARKHRAVSRAVSSPSPVAGSAALPFCGLFRGPALVAGPPCAVSRAVPWPHPVACPSRHRFVAGSGRFVVTGAGDAPAFRDPVGFREDGLGRLYGTESRCGGAVV